MKKIISVFTAFMVSVLLLGVAAMSTGAVAPWNVTGVYEVTFFLDPDTSTTPFVHHATLVQSGGTVTGDGGYPATGGDTYHYNITGTQSVDSLNLTAVYDLGAVGTTMNMTGTIAPNGTVSGTWTDDFGGPRSGTWSITKGVSVPAIHTPANNAVVTQSAFVKVDWTDSVGANPPFEYQYEAFSDAAYTTSLFLSGWLSASEIPTLGTPPGDYYLRVKARNTLLDESAWSNGAGNAHKVTVTADVVVTPSPSASPSPTPGPVIPAECNQALVYNVILGTSGSDTLNGTSGPDLILARGGSDWVDGKGGEDCIDGGNGSDSLKGGAGVDVILGGADSDSIEGENGADDLYGEGGSDYIKGGIGNDDLWGGAGSDSLQGEGGTDTANGGAGSDACSAETLVQCNP